MSLDTGRARAAILKKIRARQHRAPEAHAEETRAAAFYVQSHPAGPRPALPADLPTRFVEQAQRMASTVVQAEGVGQIPALVGSYLTQHGLPLKAIVASEFSVLDWSAAGLSAEHRAPRDGDPVSVTGTFCAVAETGSLVCLSGPETPASATLLSETHVAVVRRERIVAGMEDAWSLLRTERGELPRAVQFISGPSRTADIEQTMVLGAHGPYRVHIVVV